MRLDPRHKQYIGADNELRVAVLVAQEKYQLTDAELESILVSILASNIKARLGVERGRS